MKFIYNCPSKSSGIYQITNTHTHRIYIGQAKSFQERWYGHSNSLRKNKHQNKFIQADFNKCMAELGNDDFLEFTVLEVMENSTKEERNKREEQAIAFYFDKGKQCYNFQQKVEATGRSCYSHTPESTSEKLRKANTGRKHTEEAKAKMKELAKGRVIPPCSPEGLERMLENRKTAFLAVNSKPKSEETKAKISAALTGREGRPCTEEAKAKISKANKGREKSPELRAKISAIQTGRILSEETKAKMSLAMKGKKRTPEHQAKLSESRKRNNRERKEKQLQEVYD